MQFYHKHPAIPCPKPLTRATLRCRVSRFSVEVDLDGAPTLAHLPNSGRLTELLVRGAQVWLAPQQPGVRKTAWDVALVEYGGGLVSVDARIPNSIVEQAIVGGLILDLPPGFTVRREVAVGHSRLDFAVDSPIGRWYLEVKSVTLVEAERALFPDAPTVRGARHLDELSRLRLDGFGAMVVFVVQRPDATEFAPNAPADPAFARALSAANRVGVEVRAYRCSVSLDAIALGDRIPVLIDP
ncbi:MAG TPA: DNA/RNA nuclease SfsA [Chloroflexota bacterium]|nr:DNA/RNA nuclease SfsA [Chloroflexota bacterium]